MGCLIERNKNNKITNVSAPNGQKSEAFTAIHENVFMGNSELSVKVLYNLYSDEVQKMYNNVEDSKFVYDNSKEPRIYFKSPDGVVVEDIEQSIIDGAKGKFEIGILNTNDLSFIEVASFNTEVSDKTQAIRAGIEEGTISPRRILDLNGDTFYQGKGDYLADKLGTARLFKINFEEVTGTPVKINSNGTFEIRTPSEFRVVEKTDGDSEVIHESQVDEYLSKKNVKNKAELIVTTKNLLTTEYGNVNDNDLPVVLSEKTYMNMLTSFIGNLGFSMTTLNNYKNTFKNRHSKDIDVTALLDLTNKVVAIAEGGDIQANTTEEVVHLGIEAYSNENSIEEALVEIENTSEYTKWANIYRQKYSNQYTGIALEDAVRKEILGKVVAKAVQDRQFPQQAPSTQTIWQRVVDFLRSNFRPYQRTAINKITDDFYKALNQGNMAPFNAKKLVEKDGVFYSLKQMEDGLTQSLKDTGRIINSLADIAKEVGVSSPRVSDRNLPKKMDEYSFVTNTREIVSALQQTALLIEQRARDGKLAGIDNERIKVLADIVNTSLPVYKKALLSTTDKDVKSSSETLVKIIDGLTNEVLSLKEEIGELHKIGFDKIIKREVETHNLSKDIENRVIESFEQVNKDLNWFTKLFGLSSESSRPLLSLTAKLISSIRPTINRRSQRKIDIVIDKATENGWLNASFQEQLLAKDSDGKLTGYTLNLYDQGKYTEAENNKKLELISQIKGISLEDANNLFEKNNVDDIFETDEELNEFRREFQNWRNENTERFFTDEYYKQQEELFKLANVSEEVQEEIRQERVTIREIQNKWRDSENNIDRSKMSEEDKTLMDFEMARLKRKSSPLNQNLELKQGLIQKRFSELTQEELEKLPYYNVDGFEKVVNENPNMVMILPTTSVEDLPFESRYALDNFNQNFVRRINFSTQPNAKISDNFINKIEELEEIGDYEGVLDLLTENGAVMFTDKYYEAMTDNEGLLQTAETNLDSIKEEDLEQLTSLIKYAKDLTMKKSQFLKTFRSSRNSFQILAENISEPERVSFKQLETNLSEANRSITKILKINKVEVDRTFNPITEFKTYTNNAFNSELISKGMRNRKLDFMLNQMSESNKNDVLDLKYYMNNVLRGSRQKSTSKDRIFNNIISHEKYQEIKLQAERDSWSGERLIDELLTEIYAVEKLPAYFIERIPKEFELIQSQIRNGNLKVSERLESGGSLGEFVTIQPNYTWTTLYDDKGFTNSNYKKAFGGSQPKYELYADRKFEELFGIGIEEWNKHEDITTMVPTKNQNLFEFYKTLTDLRKDSDELNNYQGGNIYQALQMSSTMFQKFKDSTKAGGLKSGVKDLVSDVVFDKVDELEYGERISGGLAGISDVRVIPTYYRRKIEDQNALTRDLLGASLIDYKKAHERKVRTEMQDDFRAILAKAKSSKFSTSGAVFSKTKIVESGETSNTYNRLEEIINNALFGVQQSVKMEVEMFGKRVDLTRAMTRFKNFSVSTNLGFNPLVPLTSATTAIVNNLVDRATGDIYSEQAIKDSNKIVRSDIAKYITQDGRLDADSRLNVLFEAFGMKDIQSRFNETTSSRGGRLFSETPFKLDEIANVLTVQADVLYRYLYDHRVVTITDVVGNKINKLVNYDTFKAMSQTKEKSLVKAEWSQAKPLFDLIDIKGREAKPNKEYIKLFGEEMFDQHVKLVSAKAVQQNQRVDGMISQFDKTSAQMHAGWNMTMQHKSWLPVALSRQFKERGFNFIQGRYEAGYARDGFKFLLTLLKNYKNPAEFLKVWSESADGQEKANIKRFAMQALAYGAVAMLAISLMAGDDEDDSYIEDLAQIISYRTLNEVGGSNFIGVYSSIKGFLENPVTALSTLENNRKLVNALADVNSDDYLSNLAKRTVVGRRINQLSDLDTYTDSWLYMNREEIEFLYNFSKN